MEPTDDEQDHGNDGNERIGGSPTTQIGAGQTRAKKGKPKEAGTPAIQSGSGTQPGGTRNTRGNAIAIRAIRDQLERASGPLADRIAEARELLDPDFNAGDRPQSAVCLLAMERGLRELVDIFKGHFDRGLAVIGDEAPELHDYLYDAFTLPLPAATRCLGLRSHPPPAELLQIAMEHIGDLRTVRRTIEDVEKLSQLSFGTRSGTGDSLPAGDDPAVRRMPPPQQVHDPIDQDDWLLGQFPRRFEQLNIEEERRAVTPVIRSVAKVAQNPVLNAGGAGANIREWVNRTTERRERTPSSHFQQAGNRQRPPARDRSTAGNPNPCSRFRIAERIRGRDPSVLRTARRDEGTTAFETVRLQPPTFSGKPEDWTPFWSYFKRAVDDKPIPGFEKQLLLLRCLKEGSPARRAVEVYPPSDGNYPVVIQLLRERFGDTDDLQRAIRAQLLHLPPARETVQSLTTVVDEFERGVCQLEQLGANVEDASFMPLLESKLPVRILTELRIRESTSGTKWSVREFRRAVGAQVRCMRAPNQLWRQCASRSADRNQDRNRADTPKGHRIGISSRGCSWSEATPQPNDPQHLGHPPLGPELTRHTGKWLIGIDLPNLVGRSRLTTDVLYAKTRRQRFFEQRRCLRCLSSDHIASCCPRPKACRWCQRNDHHSLVCWVGSGKPIAIREPAGPETREHIGSKPVESAMMVQAVINSESNSRPHGARAKAKRKRLKLRRSPQAKQSENQGERSPGTDLRAFTARGENLPAFLMVCPVIAANDDTTRQRQTVLLMDPGSQVDYVQTILTKQLELPNAGSAPLVVQVFGGSKKKVPSAKHRVKLKRLGGGWEQLEVSSVPNVCTPIQTRMVGPGTHPGLLEPMDATVQPQIVIGIRKFWDFVIGFKKSAAGVFLIDTVFGTVLCGEHFGAHLGQSAPHNHILRAISEEENGWNRMSAASGVEAAAKSKPSIYEKDRQGIDPLNPSQKHSRNRKGPPHVQPEKRWRVAQQRMVRELPESDEDGITETCERGLSQCLFGASLLWKVMTWVTRHPIRVLNRLAGREIPEPTADQVKSQEQLQLTGRARTSAKAWRNSKRGRPSMPGVAMALLPLLCFVALFSSSMAISVILRSEDGARTSSGFKCYGTAATIIGSEVDELRDSVNGITPKGIGPLCHFLQWDGGISTVARPWPASPPPPMSQKATREKGWTLDGRDCSRRTEGSGGPDAKQ
ncbi:hypothetical protein niasHS_006599 [Heterodera schachtii]|uniref:Peptidase aspartic putative domain-containing protein n=1 Tax=Heterodera schachtii TaxID=97005 RepID=A0ABD2JHV6_HETSC